MYLAKGEFDTLLCPNIISYSHLPTKVHTHFLPDMGVASCLEPVYCPITIFHHPSTYVCESPPRKHSISVSGMPIFVSCHFSTWISYYPVKNLLIIQGCSPTTTSFIYSFTFSFKNYFLKHLLDKIMWELLMWSRKWRAVRLYEQLLFSINL